jgi:hypothetical protein
VSGLLLLVPFLLGGPGGPARGTAEASLRGLKVRVEYGRPRLFGRTLAELMDGLPEDRIWRAGFNEVTTLATEGTLLLGRFRVRPGCYSLYVHVPKDGASELILNSDLGLELGSLGRALGFPVSAEDAHRRWPHLEGYDKGNPEKGLPPIASAEVARAPLRSEHVEPLDLFTVTFRSIEGGLELELTWGETRLSAELRPAPSVSTAGAPGRGFLRGDGRASGSRPPSPRRSQGLEIAIVELHPSLKPFNP